MTETPLPGRPVRGSSSGRPLYALFDLVSRRWTLRIVWELRESPASFSALRTRCDGMSSSTLAQRLRDLLEARLIVQADGGEYELTRLGLELPDRLGPLIEWADHWAAELAARGPAPDEGGRAG